MRRMKAQLHDEAEAFFASLELSPPTSIRLHHLKGRSSFDLSHQVKWCSKGYYLETRPSFHLDPHWHAGAYYVQEASSMILDHVVSQLSFEKQSRTWLDLCAAPGGKTGILASHLGPGDVLVANEVVGQRRTILRENLTRAGYLNTFISGEQSSAFAEPFADVILIDAPCAGEGMMRKEPEAIRQWNPSLVASCSAMQKEIVHNAAKALNKDGYLIYSTCSYSMEENINNVDYFIRTHELEPVTLQFPDEWRIAEIKEGEAIGYQLYPHRVLGEGLFIAVLKQTHQEEIPTYKRIKKPFKSFEPLPALLSDKIHDPSNFLVRKNAEAFEIITADAQEKADEVLMYLQRASLIVDGGELKGKDFVPSHVMAMAGIPSLDIPVIDLDLNQALDFLERNTNSLPPASAQGWHLMRHDATNLGWAKNTQQGWKNHYPMNWRLRDRYKVRS